MRKYTATLNFLGHWPLTGRNTCIIFLRLALQSPEKRKRAIMLAKHFVHLDNGHYLENTSTIILQSLLLPGVYSSYFPHCTTYISQKSLKMLISSFYAGLTYAATNISQHTVKPLLKYWQFLFEYCLPVLGGGDGLFT